MSASHTEFLTTPFTEDSRVKIPCILHLVRLGYRYLSLKEAVWDEDTNIFPDLLRASMARINPDADADDINRLLADIKLTLDNEDLGKAFYERLTARSGLRLIDFENFDNNSFTLLMNIAHAIGEQRCSIYSQDISQKSSSLLRLNLILNNLVHSIPNIIQGNTMLHPYHREGKALRKFDYIVSNPPFKMDFSDFRNELDSKEHQERFFAGVPNIPKQAVEKMAIYQLFLQHIIHSLKPGGKAAVVVPTGFLTAQSGIDKAIRQHLVDNKMLAGVVSMPSNIFATTGTNVSIVFIDRTNTHGVVLLDASGLGTKVKDGKNQKTVLSEAEEDRIIATFNAKQDEDGFAIVASYGQIAAKNYSLSAGQYFDVKIEYSDLTPEQFTEKLQGFNCRLDALFKESAGLEVEIKKQLMGLQRA